VTCKYCGRRYLAVDHPEAERVQSEGQPYTSAAA
jgi:hypothetical protein